MASATLQRGTPAAVSVSYPRVGSWTIPLGANTVQVLDPLITSGSVVAITAVPTNAADLTHVYQVGTINPGVGFNVRCLDSAGAALVLTNTTAAVPGSYVVLKY
jgi:hypothetical protein